ncbi:MAG: hypothetical protein ACP5QR_13950, partial [Rhizomicrobium sp.]
RLTARRVSYGAKRRRNLNRLSFFARFFPQIRTFPQRLCPNGSGGTIMSKQSAAIEAALAQLSDEGCLDIQLCPLQTLDKSMPNNGLVLWFTFCMRGENPQRVLTLLFDRTKEVQLPGPAYITECRARIVEAIRQFWDGETSELNREVAI